jgi:hypothetical protein
MGTELLLCPFWISLAAAIRQATVAGAGVLYAYLGRHAEKLGRRAASLSSVLLVFGWIAAGGKSLLLLFLCGGSLL